MDEIWTKEDVERSLKQGHREFFQRILSKYIRTVPSDKALSTFGERQPDRHAQATAIYARLAGYTEKLDVQMDASVGMIDFNKLSDSELYAKILQLREENQKALGAGNGDLPK